MHEDSGVFADASRLYEAVVGRQERRRDRGRLCKGEPRGHCDNGARIAEHCAAQAARCLPEHRVANPAHHSHAS